MKIQIKYISNELYPVFIVHRFTNKPDITYIDFVSEKVVPR